MAMASYPNYNPRIWLDGVTETEYKRLTDESANAPLISRATQGLFPPASTFKVVTTLAAERARVPMGSTLYECPSFLQIGDRKMRNNESNAYGNISVARALEVSCNTVFYRIGYQMWLKDGGNNPQKSPADPIEKAARDFGFGKQTGIDLPSENSGRVGGRAFKTSQYEQYKDIWCFRAKQGYPKIAATDPERAAYLKLLAQENCRYGYIYRGGDAANLSIGQGDTVATPLQVAQLYSAIANGGTIYQPRVVKAIVSADGKTIKKIKPKVAGKVKISASLKAYLDRALSGVVTEGTATSPFANWPQNRVAVAAKTGSGQMGNNKDATSWFASYAPVNNPRYAVVMMVSQGGTGALTSGPSVRKIYEAIYGIEGTDRKKKSAVLENSEPAKRLPTIKKDGSVNAVPGTKRIDELLRAKYIGGGNG
jgi:penicillin-binding protein 2